MSISYAITGALKIFANPSLREKDTHLPSAFVDTARSSETLESVLRAIRVKAAGGASDLSAPLERYLDLVHTSPTSPRNTADMEILRHAPTTAYTINTAKKLFVQNGLMPYYRAHRPSCHWAYVNYHSLNFFTSSAASG